MYRRNSPLRKPLALLLTLAMALSLAVTVWAVPPEEHTNLVLACNPSQVSVAAPRGVPAEAGFTVQLMDWDTGEVLDWTGYMSGISLISADVQNDYHVHMDGNRAEITIDGNLLGTERYIEFTPKAYDSGGIEIKEIESASCSVIAEWYNASAASGYVALTNWNGTVETEYIELDETGRCTLPSPEEVPPRQEVTINLDAPGAVDAYGDDYARSCMASYTFAGWNTRADGSGAAYEPGDVCSIPGYDPEDPDGMVLYPQWEGPVLTGEGMPGPTALPFRDGYLFAGFYGPEGEKLTLEKGAPVTAWATYYARWEAGTSLAITQQPAEKTKAPGDTPVGLTLTAVGEGLTYQWFYQEKDSHRLWGPFFQPKPAASPDFTLTTQTQHPVGPEEPDQTWYAWCLVTDRLGNQVRSKDAEVTFYYPQGVPQYEPNGWWNAQAMEGYTEPLSTTVLMSVSDSLTDGPILYTVNSFHILCTNCDTEADLNNDQAQTYLSCAWEGGVITVTIAPGLPAGTYTWVVIPNASAEGAEVFPLEFTVNCTIIARDPGLVYYDPNGGAESAYPTAVTDPVTSVSPYRNGVEYTLDPNGGRLHFPTTGVPCTDPVTQYAEWKFTGWNTKADGSGRAYSAGDKYTGPGGEVLYAQWAGPFPRTVPGGTEEDGQWVDRDGVAFAGWFSKKTGGTRLTETTPVTEGSVWYARWAGLVSYDGNGGTGVPAAHPETENIPGFWPQRQQEEFTLDANGGIFHHPKTTETTTVTAETGNWNFTGWNTKADGSGKTCQPGDPAAGLGGKTLYAQWSGLYPIGIIGDTDNGLTWVEWPNHTFLGWFSEKTGGDGPLTTETAVSKGSVWYAHWEITDPSALIPAVGDVSLSDGEVSVQVTCNQEGAWVWCAVYDENGKMLGVQKQQARVGEDETYVFEFGEAANTADMARVFLLSADGDPLCDSNQS